MKGLIVALWLFALAAVEPEMRYFRYQRPLTVPPGATGQTCLAVDAQTFAHAAPGLADLRLYRNGAEVPFALHTAAAESAGTEIAPLNLGLEGGLTAFDAAMPAGEYSDVELQLDAHDFLATVTVTGRDDEHGAKGTELGSFTVFDFTRERLGRSTVLHLPKSNRRYLHFVVSKGIEPAQVKGLSAPGGLQRQVRFVPVATAAQMGQRQHASFVEFTVPANVPVDRIVFAAGPEPGNFSRDVSVSVTAQKEHVPVNDGSDVPSRATEFSGSLLRLHRTEDGHRIDEERLALDTSGQSIAEASHWTVTVNNGDDPPLPLGPVQLEMTERDVCFDSSGGTAPVLFYGDPALGAPHYDYQALFSPEAHPAEAAAGQETQNASYQPRPDARPFSERHPALLWISLVAVLLLLGGVAVRTGIKQQHEA